jgi:excisionase family DNA binding protein
MSVNGNAQLEPLLIPVKTAFEMIGVGYSKGYELVRSGRLIAVKQGSRTMIDYQSLKAYRESLPRVIMAGRPAPLERGQPLHRR